jgi:hypothetical protein
MPIAGVPALLTMIDREIRRRQALFRQSGANALPEYRQNERLPAWVAVIESGAIIGFGYLFGQH